MRLAGLETLEGEGDRGVDDLDRFGIGRDQARFREGGEAVVRETRRVACEADLSDWRRGRRRRSLGRRRSGGGRGFVRCVVGGVGDGGVDDEGKEEEEDGGNGDDDED